MRLHASFLATIFAVCSSAAMAANITVVVAGAGDTRDGPTRMNVGAKVTVVSEDGTGSVGFTDGQGKVSMQIPSTRSFIIEVTAGPGKYAATNRMYGQIDHVVSIYMGPTPAFAFEDGLGADGEAIRHMSADLEKGISRQLKEGFFDPKLDKMIDNAEKSTTITPESAAEYRKMLNEIRDAKVKTDGAAHPAAPRRRFLRK